MANRYIDKVSATTEIKNLPGAAGVGVLNGDLFVHDGTAARQLVKSASAVAGLKIARGQHTTVAAVDTVVTGLSTVVAVVATLDSDPADDPEAVTASIGDQAGSPAAGSIYIKSWKNTGGTDPTLVAATTFTKKVNWIAIGT